MSEEEKVNIIFKELETIQDYGICECTIKAKNGRMVKKSFIKSNMQVAKMLAKAGILKEN